VNIKGRENREGVLRAALFRIIKLRFHGRRSLIWSEIVKKKRKDEEETGIVSSEGAGNCVRVKELRGIGETRP